ncbi:hypothetical protein [Shimia sp. MIT1388]|uniref:hypothetical protein n=1 Tax=Shimia sp. MIT1388 TaxID=3096992 RepID=UPI00399C294F
MHDALENYTQKLYQHSIREWPLPGCFFELHHQVEKLPLGWQALDILSSKFKEPWPEKLDDLPRKLSVLFRYLVARFELPNADYEQWTETQYGKWGEDNLAGLLESWGPKTVTGVEQFSFEFGDELSFRYAYPPSWTHKHMIEEARRAYELCGLRLDRSVGSENALILAQSIPVPEVWHSILSIRVLYEMENNLDVVKWITRQSNCDAGSALYAMFSLKYYSEGEPGYDPNSAKTKLYKDLLTRLQSGFYVTAALVSHYPSQLDQIPEHLRPFVEHIGVSDPLPPRGTLFSPDDQCVVYGCAERYECDMSGDRTPAVSAILSDLPAPPVHNSFGRTIAQLGKRVFRRPPQPS